MVSRFYVLPTYFEEATIGDFPPLHCTVPCWHVAKPGTAGQGRNGERDGRVGQGGTWNGGTEGVPANTTSMHGPDTHGGGGPALYAVRPSARMVSRI